MIRLAHPLWLALALLVLGRAVLLWRDRRARVGAFGFSSLSLADAGRGLRIRTALLPFVVETIALLLIVLALARPQRVTRLATSDRFGIDIVIALDSSGSMAAEDFRPRNRFTVAKELIADFIRGRQDDRIGLVTFGSRAATRVPITYDRRITEGILDRAEIGEHGQGTAIGHALATAVNRLRTSKTRSRVVILVTDGVNSAGSIDPRVAAQLAARSGIKVYTIGVGSEGPVPLPVKRQNPFTGMPETVYTHIRGELDEPTLSAIAEITNGEYFRATDARALSSVLRRIDALEKTRLTTPKREQIEELYATPLVWGLALLAMALLAGETVWMKVPGGASPEWRRAPARVGGRRGGRRNGRRGAGTTGAHRMMFRNVTMLWLLAAVPLALVFLVTRERLRTRVARRFASERLRGVTNAARSLRPWLLGLGAAAALVALAGPYAGFTLVPIVAREANRVIVVDVSNSMAAEDVGTSRLNAAKALAVRLARTQQGRVALVVFEAQPEVVSPLTTDGEAVATLIDTLQPGELGAPGSDLGSALLAALRLIETEPGQKADLVVLSDGEDQGTRVAEAVQRAKARAIEVSTIVIGSAEGSTIPAARGPLRDSSGEVVTTYARGDVLGDVARATGGKFLENPFADRALDPIVDTGRGSGAAMERKTHTRVPIDRYQWPLALAFFAFLGGSLLHRGAE